MGIALNMMHIVVVASLLYSFKHIKAEQKFVLQ
jgi:hypothetical protein